MYLHVLTIFSRFRRTKTQFMHFVSDCIREKGEGGERYLGEGNKNMSLYNFLSLYTNKIKFYTLVVEEASERWSEKGERRARV